MNKYRRLSILLILLISLILLFLIAGYIWYRQPIQVQRTIPVTSAGGEEKELTAELTLRRYLLRPLSVQGVLRIDGRTFSYVPYDRPSSFFQRFSADIRDKFSPPDTAVFKEAGSEQLQILYVYDFFACPGMSTVHLSLPNADGTGWTEFFGPVLQGK